MKLKRQALSVPAAALGLLLATEPAAAESILLEVAITESPFTILSTKRVAIPVGEAAIIEATDRYKLAVTPTQIDDSGRVHLEILVRDVTDIRRIKKFISPNFGTPVRIVRGSPGEQSIEIVAWSR